MSKEQQKSGAHASKAKSNYDGQEVESRRDGTQARLKEKVVDAVEDASCIKSAKSARFASNGEPSLAPKA